MNTDLQLGKKISRKIMKKESSWSLGSEGALWEAPPVVDPSHFSRITFRFGERGSLLWHMPWYSKISCSRKRRLFQRAWKDGEFCQVSCYQLCPSPSPFPPCPHHRLYVLPLTFSPAPISTSSPALFFQHSNFKCRALSPQMPTTPSSVASSISHCK